ncbi:MAG: HAMP domain-containing protein [Gammaproteobacteria bacterium]|nr:HAMP domain-containing protein [Gammaproteobacteria bacterium]
MDFDHRPGEQPPSPQPATATHTTSTKWLWPSWLPNHIPIAYKLALILTLLISSGMVILGLIIVSNQAHVLSKQINNFGRAMTNQLAEASKELVLSDDILSLMVVVNNLNTTENILGAVVYSHKGEILAQKGRLPVHTILNLYNHATPIDDDTYSINWTDYDAQGNVLDITSFLTPIRYQKTIVGHVLVSYDRSSLTHALHDTIQAITAATLFMILLGIISAYFIGKRLTQPLHNLMDASRAIHNGNFTYRIAERRNDEIGYLMNAFNSMASGLLEKHQVENAFSRFVSNKVAKQIMDNLDHIKLGGKRVNATAVFADIVGFTSLSEKLPAEEIALMLNEYFSYIDAACHLYRGIIDKFMGDCAMLIFGAPEEDSEHKFHAIACAVLIQGLIDRLNIERIQNGRYPVYFRIGINSGEMLAGNMGSHDRMQYTVVGEAVNLASRLHTVADRGQIIITECLVRDPDVAHRIIAEQHQSIRLRGIAEPVTTYRLSGLVGADHLTVQSQLGEILRKRKVA